MLSWLKQVPYAGAVVGARVGTGTGAGDGAGVGGMTVGNGDTVGWNVRHAVPSRLECPDEQSRHDSV